MPVGEAGFFEYGEEDLPRYGAGNSIGPWRLVRWGPVTDQSNVAGLKPTAGTQHSENLSKGCRLVRDQVEDPVADGYIKGGVRIRQGLDGGLAELDLGKSRLDLPGAGDCKHLWREVDPYNVTLESDVLRSDKGIEPGATAQVQH